MMIMMKYLPRFLLFLTFITLVNGDTNGYDCVSTSSSVKSWILVLLLIPTVLNIASICLLVFAMTLITKLKTVVEAISSSTHWLTRTAIRVGLGPTAKKALIEYAKSKPEFKKLVG